MAVKAANTTRQKQSVKQNRSAVKASSKVEVRLNLAHSINFDVNGRKIKINGQNEKLRGEKEGILIVGGYGKTILDQQDWDELVRLYGRMAIFKNGLIFAMGDSASADDRAKELKELRHGLEPVDTRKTVTEADK